MKQVWFPRAARGVRLLATLAVAAGLVAGFAAAAAPGRASAQSAGLDEYRFPAGTAVSEHGHASDSDQPAGAADAVDLPGGYPLTTPVLALCILLLAGIAAGVVVKLGRRPRHSAAATSAPER